MTIGRKLTIGPVRGTPNRLAEPAPLEDGDQRAEGRAKGEQEPERGLQRYEDGPEHQQEQQQGQADDDRVSGSAEASLPETSMLSAVVPVT